jgi:hypothetical protein
MMDDDREERAAIMEFCGGLPRFEAERLAQVRPWDSDPQWRMPRPKQMELLSTDTAPDDGREPEYIKRLKEKYCKMEKP